MVVDGLAAVVVVVVVTAAVVVASILSVLVAVVVAASSIVVEDTDRGGMPMETYTYCRCIYKKMTIVGSNFIL